MVKKEKYSFTCFHKLISLNTLSPNGEYYYRMISPREINMGNYGGEIAFYNVGGELLYFRNGYVAHCLLPADVIWFVCWSRQGGMAYFYEYLRSKQYAFVFLDFLNEEFYRLDLYNEEYKKLIDDLTLVDKQYDENVVKAAFLSKGIMPEKFTKDVMPKFTLSDRIFRSTKWYPKLK